MKYIITDEDLMNAQPALNRTDQMVRYALQKAGAPIDGILYLKVRDGFHIKRCYPGDRFGTTIYEIAEVAAPKRYTPVLKSYLRIGIMVLAAAFFVVLYIGLILVGHVLSGWANVN